MQGEILMVNKLAYKLGEVEYGDIVTFHYPNDPKLDYVKRAIGLPGDTVEVKGRTGMGQRTRAIRTLYLRGAGI